MQGCAAAFVVCLLALTAVASDARQAPKLKLPAERTSPTGNFFTLEADQLPTSSNPVANFEVKVCTSAHTPKITAIEPAFFTVTLVQGGRVAESISAAKSPALTPKPLKALQCVQGWLGFKVPKSKTVLALEYYYSGQISWTVG